MVAQLRIAVLAVVTGIVLGACSNAGESPAQTAETPRVQTTEVPKERSVASPRKKRNATGCVPPSPVWRGGYRLKGFCPRSKPVPVGGVRKFLIGMVHKSRCWAPPDFAGSFWMTHTHLPDRAMSALHGGITGHMTLVRKDAAVFRAPAVMTRTSLDEPLRRVPARGGFLLEFHRIEGGIRTAGCD